MGLSSNQARFLSLTSRQVDLEHRIQQICQRRLRLSSELENVATSYNKSITNRHMYIPPQDGHDRISVDNLSKYGYYIMRASNSSIVGSRFLQLNQLTASDVQQTGATNAITALNPDLKTVTYLDVKTGNMVNAIGIYSAAALNALSSNQSTTGLLSSNYILMADVNMSSFNWTALGTNANRFTGFFNGNMHNINNLTMNYDGAGTMSYQGMFGASAGDIRNVNINNLSMRYDSIDTGALWSGYLGGIVGYNYSAGNVENCNITNLNMVVDGTAKEIGGIIGENEGLVDKCSVSGSMQLGTVLSDRADDVGGLVGWEYQGNVTKSYSDVDITVNGTTQYVGVFMGYNNTNLSDCYSTGSLTINGTNGGSTSGQLIGSASSGTMHNCYYFDGQIIDFTKELLQH